LIGRAFDAFTAFREDPGVPMLQDGHLGRMPGDFVATIEVADVKVGLLGLNTAFLQLSDRAKEGSLAILSRQLNDVAGPGGVESWKRCHDLCILLTHHPLSWLDGASRQGLQDTVLNTLGSVPLHLCGHLHEPQLDAVALGGGPPLHTIRAPSLFGLPAIRRSGEPRIHGYSMLELCLYETGRRTLRVWPKTALRMPDGPRVLIPDATRYRLAFNDVATDELNLAAPGQSARGGPEQVSDWCDPSTGPKRSTFTLPDILAGVVPLLGGDQPVEPWMWNWMILADLLSEFAAYRKVPDSDPVIEGMGQNLRGFLQPFRLDAPPLSRGRVIRRILRGVMSQRGIDAEVEIARCVASGEALSPAVIAVWSWWKLLEECGDDPRPLNRLALQLAAITGDDSRDVEPLIQRFMWRYGPRTEHYEESFGAALKDLYETVERELRDHFVKPLNRVDDLAKLLLDVLPESLANMLITSEWKPEPIQETLLADRVALDEVCDGKRSKLITGPAGCGKSLLARLVTAARERRHGPNVIVTVPTRALVNQVADDYLRWSDSAGLHWRIVRGSRDYHRDDAALHSGDFDVAVCVYEKLGAMLSMPGSDLMLHCGLIVVDEAHNVGSPGRGSKLEELLTLVRLHHPNVPLLLVSAGIEEDTADRLIRWLGLRPLDDVLTATVMSDDGEILPRRPVPLDIHVISPGTHWAMRDPSSPYDSTANSGVREVLSELDLSGAALSLSEEVRAQVATLASGHAIPVVGDILAKTPHARILVFVRSRALADQTARELRKVLHEATRAQSSTARTSATPNDDKNPWIVGRFASIDLVDAREHYDAFCRTVAWQGRDEVRTALVSGVGVHRGGMTHVLRGYVEREFTRPNGLLRVLVSTDTLAEGVNMPADVVILANLTTSSSTQGSVRVVDLANFKNKIGRAGRKGHSSHGHAYVLTPERMDGLTVESNSAVRRSWITSPESVWENFVAPHDPGAPIDSDITDVDGFATLALRHFGRVQRGRRSMSRAEQELEASRVMEASLAAQCARPLPLPGDVVARLEQCQCIDGGRLTPLGLSVSRGSLSVADAQPLKELSDAFASRASTLSIYYFAAKIPSVGQSLNRMGISPALSAPTLAFTRRGLSLWASVWMSGVRLEDPQSLESWANLTRARLGHQGRAHIKGELPPAPPFAAEQRDERASSHAVFNGPLDHVAGDDAVDLTALLRALVAVEWSTGQPFKALVARARRIVSDAGAEDNSARRPPAPFELGDLEQLVGLLSWGIRAASMTLPPGETRARAVVLGGSVAVGLPAWLAPLARLEIPGLHREILLPFAGGSPYADLPSFLSEHPSPLADADCDLAIARLNAIDADREQFAGRVLDQRRALSPRDGAPDYGARAHELRHAGDASAAALSVVEILSDHGVESTRGEPRPLDEGAVVVVRVRFPEPLDVAVFAGARRLKGSVLRELSAEGQVVLSIPGLDDAAKALAEDGTLFRVGSFLNAISGAFLDAPDEDSIPQATLHALTRQVWYQASETP
jgi:superfamily II DNA/RNA helicase